MEDDVKPDLKQVNPWLVSNLDTFLYYTCPECDLRTKEYDNFYEHAVQKHPNSKIAEWYEEPFGVKEETDYYMDQDEYHESDEDLEDMFDDLNPLISENG